MRLGERVMPSESAKERKGAQEVGNDCGYNDDDDDDYDDDADDVDDDADNADDINGVGEKKIHTILFAER